MVVGEPFEFWDMNDGETREIKVETWEEGETEITPRYLTGGQTKTIPVLRLNLKEGIKEYLPNYWDITSKHLITALLPYLKTVNYRDLVFTITKHGEAPRARFSMNVKGP